MPFSPDLRESLQTRLFRDRELPDFAPFTVEDVSFLDGCKVRFTNGGWVVIRFSGTEPLLRVFAEMPTEAEAKAVCERVKVHFGI